MRIRTRLTILLIVVVVVALVFVGVSGLSLYQSKSVESSAKYKLLELQYAASVKNNLLEILSSVACEWLHGAGHQSHAQTMELGEKIGRTLTSWHELEMLQAQQFGEAQQLGNVNQLNNIIAHYQSSLARHHDDMLLAKQAGSGSSNAFINSTLLLGGDLILAGKLEEATSKILIQADAVLNSLFLFVGWVPWISSATKIQTEHARAALQYYAALDRAQTSFVQELQVILQFLVRDKELARRDVLEMALQTQNRLEDVLDVVKNQMALGVEGEEEDRLAVEKFIAEQNARVELFLFFYDFKKANNLQADLTPDQHEKLDLIVLDAADFFRKRLSDGQGEIAESVQVLLRKSSEVRMILTGFFLALWVITTSFLVGLGLRIFRSLQKLQRGTSQLAAGNFEHRIDLSSSDEFGDVASSFNAMVSQLHSSRQELMGLNMKLGEEIVVRSQAEEALAVQAGQLRERVKELQCLHKITIILETADVSLPEILQRIVNELPGAWQFPDISCARISLAEMDLCTAGFKKTIWRQACDIIINGRPKGVLEVCYREERPAADEGPFLKEERFLLEIIAARLAHFYGRVKTEQELRLSQERLAAAQRIARLGNWIWELNENKMWWSDEVYEIFALDPATYVPTFDSFLARVYPADCERFAQAIEKSLADKAHCSVEHRIILPSGVVRTVQEDGEIICDQSGQAVKILGTVQDISRFKAIERALQDSEVKFRNLVEQFPGVIYIAAIDESNTLIYVSPQIKTMLGFSPKIWKKNKKIWSSRLHPDDRERVLAEIRESRQNVTPFFSEYRIFSRNKRMVWLRHEAVIVREPDGVPIFMQGMMTDITALKEVAQEQETMQAVMRQQEKMASIGQLAAGVAHEINNPMGFIGSNLGTMGKYVRKLTDFLRLQDQIIREKRYDEMIDSLEGQRKKDKIDYIMDDVVDLVAESQDGVERVKKIVQGLKSFSRVDEAQFNEVDVKECLESTINIIWNELKYKAEVVKDFGSLPLFKGYPQQLNQVFMNLLVNAAQAIEENGKIFISARSDGDDIIIAIRDTGQGIPADILPRIFDPFFTTKEVGKGTGLGLSISYEIIKKHGGIISVESEVGVGTTFTVNIPIKGQTQDAIALN